MGHPKIKSFQQHKVIPFNGQTVDGIEASQIAVWICFSLLSITTIRYYLITNSKRKIPSLEKFSSNQRILAVLPFRNEELIIKKSLSRVLSETFSDKNCKLVLVNSASHDGSVEAILETIAESGLEAGSWCLINSDKPGKGRALNMAMSNYIDEDIVIMIDADALIPKGSFETFRKLMSNEEIGAISAQESIRSEDPMAEYKTRSNELRRFESSTGQCPILEGSFLAWSPSRIEWSSFDENSNADDAQIALCSIRSGHKSHVTSEMKFTSLRDSKKASFQRSVRRSQGLNKQLLRNIDIFWDPSCRQFRSTFFFNILLHCIIPWCVVFLLFSPLIIIQYPEFTKLNPNFYSMVPSLIILISLFSRSGRSLLRGSLASIFGQLRVLLRMRANYWEPGEG